MLLLTITHLQLAQAFEVVCFRVALIGLQYFLKVFGALLILLALVESDCLFQHGSVSHGLLALNRLLIAANSFFVII